MNQVNTRISLIGSRAYGIVDGSECRWTHEVPAPARVLVIQNNLDIESFIREVRVIGVMRTATAERYYSGTQKFARADDWIIKNPPKGPVTIQAFIVDAAGNPRSDGWGQTASTALETEPINPEEVSREWQRLSYAQRGLRGYYDPGYLGAQRSAGISHQQIMRVTHSASTPIKSIADLARRVNETAKKITKALRFRRLLQMIRVVEAARMVKEQ